jgi:hypothetical protein
MKLTRLLVFSAGLAVGYVAGTAAGRERFDKMTQSASGLASDLGLKDLSERLAQRSTEVARATAQAAEGMVDTAADKVTNSVSAAEQEHVTSSSATKSR